MSEVMLALIEVPVDPDDDPPEQWMTDYRVPELAGVTIIWSRREQKPERAGCCLDCGAELHTGIDGEYCDRCWKRKGVRQTT